MDPTLGVIESGDILLDNGRIIAIGPKAGSWAVTEIDGRGMIAVPGFINGHIHLWQTALRGVAADWTLDHYFGALIGHVVKLYEPRDAYIGNLVGALDQINCGVTTLFDWCHIVNTPGHADAAVDALQDSGIRAIFAYGTPMTLFGTTEPHPSDAARGTDFAPGTAEADIRYAHDLDLLASFHVACAKHGPRPQNMQSLASQGLLGPDINLVHANFLTPEEFRVIADKGASISITPEVEMQMGLGLPPTEAALGARAQVNIGTDVVTGVSTDIFTQMRFLLQTQRALANDRFHKQETMPDKLTMTTKQVLELVTIKSAECFGLGKRLGSLAPGKEADIALIRKSDINMRAAADPISTVVLHAGVANVDTVIVGGNIVKQNGRLLFRDLPRKLEDLDRSSQRLHAGFNAKATAA